MHVCTDEPQDVEPGIENHETVQRAAALFLLKTAEKHKLPLSSMDGLMLDVQQLNSTVLDKVAEKSKQFLNEEDAESLCATLHDESIRNPFVGLHNAYQQTKYYREHLGLIVSFISNLFYSSLPLLTMV